MTEYNYYDLKNKAIKNIKGIVDFYDNFYYQVYRRGSKHKAWLKTNEKDCIIEVYQSVIKNLQGVVEEIEKDNFRGFYE